MYRYFTHVQSYNYIVELQKVAGSYNKTYHRTIGMFRTRGRTAKKHIYGKKSKKVRKPFRFRVGDR